MCHSFRRGTMQMYQIREANSKLQNPYSQFFDLPIVITSCSNKSRSPAALLRTFVR